MVYVEPLPMLKSKDHSYRGAITDSILAIGCTFLFTGIIYIFHLYPILLDSFLLYLLVILTLASTRGIYPAFLASIVAFFSFDFFFVPPVYSLLITKFADILTLIVFMITAVLTSKLAAAQRLRAELAQSRERETRILYNLVRATNREEDTQLALTIFVQTVVEVFSPWGIRDCILLLPDMQGHFTQQIKAHQQLDQQTITLQEHEIIAQVAKEGKIVDLSDTIFPSNLSTHTPSGIKKWQKREKRMMYRSIRLIPLATDQKVVGVLHVLIEHDSKKALSEGMLGIENEQPTPQALFFSTFLEQAVAVIERGRLRQENVDIKVLQQTDALRSALLSSVSHDLRTPLSIIKTSATSLLEDEVEWDEEAQRTFISAIEREADRLNSLVENLLDMSRIEAGALCPEKVWYPIDELIRDVLDRMHDQLQGRAVQIRIPDNLPPIKLDYVYIDQVVTNLIENVIHHTPAGSPIDISILVQGEYVLVSIADRGPGIGPCEKEHIFDKFYRVLGRLQGLHHTRGSGLGLAICRGLVEAHGGKIWVEPREGGGTVFYFSLPLTTMEGTLLDE